MTKEQSEKLADMREEMLASHPRDAEACSLAGKLLGAHAAKSQEAFFCVEFTEQAGGTTVEQRLDSVKDAYGLLEQHEFVKRLPLRSGEGKKAVPMSRYVLSDNAKRVLGL